MLGSEKPAGTRFWIDLPRTCVRLPPAYVPGDRLWPLYESPLSNNNLTEIV